ncbi:MAG: hypothetical protein LKG38_03220 [Atopobiaceae bacterium]|jgi:hypothetical protein|nr:hypothetical protein [Atopobiaceae bacterium]MCH4119788.1 hypothetical protein [Atopobiaceae bacterium]MCI1318336.1 hypothetical protein [Atopobiaceae bacterium]MCI1388863.1 hypothetical protein [Atopobiaceae bacterium]MCI1432517.1 hypothetical protein [Atopobiaceae bacterium]
MERLEVTFDGQSFYADLLPDKAPKVIEALREKGEFESFLVYAKICDHELTWTTPVYVDECENPVWDETPGNVIYYPPNQAICIFYGASPSVAECSKFAQMPKDELERMVPSADKAWAGQGMRIVTRIVDDGRGE